MPQETGKGCCGLVPAPTVAAFDGRQRPVSVVIPSYARMEYLVWSLSLLLKLEPLERKGSEILVAHGSNASLAYVSGAACKAQPACHSPKVWHVDVIDLDASGIGVASRYFAAAKARNDILVHLDDDLVPSQTMLQDLVDKVASEAGFPSYPHAHAPGLYGASSQFRCCGVSGLLNCRYPRDSPTLVLTSLAACSKALNTRYLDFFDAYRPLLLLNRGNGEDITYSHFAWLQGRGAASDNVRHVGNCSSDAPSTANGSREAKPWQQGLRSRYRWGRTITNKCGPTAAKSTERTCSKGKGEFVPLKPMKMGVPTFSDKRDVVTHTKFKASRDAMCVALFSIQGSSHYPFAQLQESLLQATTRSPPMARVLPLQSIGATVVEAVSAVERELLAAYTANPKQSACACMRASNYSQQWGLIFVHVPKTGGTSIEEALLGGAVGPGTKLHSCHASLSDLLECTANSTPAFYVWRHPLDRLVSLFEYAKAGGNGERNDLLRYAWMRDRNFSNFVHELARIRGTLGQLPNIFKTQSSWMGYRKRATDERATISSATRRNGTQAEVIALHFHALTQGWRGLANQYPRLPQRIGHSRVSRHACWPSYYTDPLINELTRLLYEDDFELVHPSVVEDARSAAQACIMGQPRGLSLGS